MTRSSDDSHPYLGRAGGLEERAPTHAPGSSSRASFELTCFAELLGLLAHDLNNPLQSLTMLLELTLDDASLGPDGATKIRQALDAVADMQGSIRNVAEFAQAGSRSSQSPTVHTSVERCTGIVQRRLQRQKFSICLDIGAIGQGPSGGLAFEFDVLAALLTLSATASRSRLYAFELTISSARLPESTPPPTSAASAEPVGYLQLRLRGSERDGTWRPVAINHERHPPPEREACTPRAAGDDLLIPIPAPKV